MCRFPWTCCFLLFLATLITGIEEHPWQRSQQQGHLKKNVAAAAEYNTYLSCWVCYFLFPPFGAFFPFWIRPPPLPTGVATLHQVQLNIPKVWGTLSCQIAASRLCENTVLCFFVDKRMSNLFPKKNSLSFAFLKIAAVIREWKTDAFNILFYLPKQEFHSLRHK